METNRMKMGLAYIFSENMKISKAAKLQLLKFIEQADGHQIKILAMDGEVIDRNTLDESSKTIIDDRFEGASIAKGSLRKASVEAMKQLASMKKK